MKIIFLLVGIYLVFSGLYSLYGSYKNKKSVNMEFYNTTFIEKKILGKYFDRWHNFFWGAIKLISGVLIVVNYF
jgi:uncharacterized membrane protein HdeD (DUF308 family)